MTVLTSVFAVCVIALSQPAQAPGPVVANPFPQSVEEIEGRTGFDCDRLQGLWIGRPPSHPRFQQAPAAMPAPGNEEAASPADDAPAGPSEEQPEGTGAEQRLTPEEAAEIYAEYFRHIFLTDPTSPLCAVPYDPLITVANACAVVARNQGNIVELAAVIGSSPDTVQGLWLLDRIIRGDSAHAGLWRAYFGPGPAQRVIELLFSALPTASAPVYQALFFLTGTAEGSHADYIAQRFVELFAAEPGWVVSNANLLTPFAPTLRLIFCNYLTVPEREMLVMRIGELPYSNAQHAIMQLVACR